MTSGPVHSPCLDALWPSTWPRAHLHLASVLIADQAPSAHACAALGLSLIEASSKRQAQWFAGRQCALQALRAQGFDQAPQRGEDGAPSWPCGAVGSISHSHGHAVAVVGRSAHYQSLGLDIEAPLEPLRAQKLTKALLTCAELERLKALSPAEQTLAIGWSFALKESLFKALFPLTGVRFYFQHAETLSPPKQGAVSIRLLKELSQDWPAGSVITGYCDYFQTLLASLVPLTRPAAECAATAD